MALQLETVCTSISGITVTGLTIKDMPTIPEWISLNGPTMFPKPDGLITNFSFKRVSQGMATAKMDCNYTLNYLLVYSSISGTIPQYKAFAAMIGMALDIIDAIMATAALGGAVMFEMPVIGDIGVIEDPKKNQFWGCSISIAITEFQN